MADRIENNLPAQSDAAYIRALDNSGNPIRISKADLAQVVAELMPVATAEKNGLACRLLNVQSFNASLNKTFLIADVTNLLGDVAYYIKVLQIINNENISSGNFTCIDIGYAKSRDAIHAYGISAKGGNPFSIKLYTQGQRLYYQVNSIGGYVHFIGANVDVSVVTLPEGAVEVTIE